MKQSLSSNLDRVSLRLITRLLPYLVIAIVSLLVFGQVYNHQFLFWDDYPLLVENESLNPFDWTGFIWIWKKPWCVSGAPLVPSIWGVITILSTDSSDAAQASQVSPEFFHLLQLILHLLTSFVVFAILHHLIRQQLAALLGSLLFAIHPIQTETAAWITQTSFTAAGLFCVGAILCYLYAVDTALPEQTLPPGDARLRIKFRVLYTAATALYLGAILCSTVAIVLPFVVAPLVVGFKRSPYEKLARQLGPWLIVSAAVIVIVNTVADSPAYRTAPLWIRPGIVLDIFAFRCMHLLLPRSTYPYYEHSFEDIWRNGNLYWCWFFSAVALVFASTTNHRRVWLALVVGMILSIVPRIVLLPPDPARATLVGNQYAYLWMLFPSLGLAFWVAVHPHPFYKLITMVVLSVLAVISHGKASRFSDDRSMAVYVLEGNSRSCEAYRVVAKVLATFGEFDASIRHLRWALNIEPLNARVHQDLAKVLMMQGKVQQSLLHLEQAAEMQPRQAEYLNNLAWCLATNSDPRYRDGPRAVALALDACEQSDWHVSGHIDTLAAAYAEVGDFESAVRSAEKAIDLSRTQDRKLAYSQRQRHYRNREPYHVEGTGPDSKCVNDM